MREGYYKKGGVNPPPKYEKPNFTPPPQTPKKDKKNSQCGDAMEYSYDEIYGVDIDEYAKLHGTTDQDLIEKTKLDIDILSKRLRYLVEHEDNMGTNHLITVVFNTISKKQKHLSRLEECQKK
jgi:hypothetical protein